MSHHVTKAGGRLEAGARAVVPSTMLLPNEMTTHPASHLSYDRQALFILVLLLVSPTLLQQVWWSTASPGFVAANASYVAVSNLVDSGADSNITLYALDGRELWTQTLNHLGTHEVVRTQLPFVHSSGLRVILWPFPVLS
jgi:hypothetical protein